MEGNLKAGLVGVARVRRGVEISTWSFSFSVL